MLGPYLTPWLARTYTAGCLIVELLFMVTDRHTSRLSQASHWCLKASITGCRPIVILAQRDKEEMDDELKSALKGYSLEWHTRHVVSAAFVLPSPPPLHRASPRKHEAAAPCLACCLPVEGQHPPIIWGPLCLWRWDNSRKTPLPLAGRAHLTAWLILIGWRPGRLATSFCWTLEKRWTLLSHALA